MPAHFSDDDRAFLRCIFNDPADQTAWLVYADWLDEHEQFQRAEFLRLQIRRVTAVPNDPDAVAVEERLRELRATIHPDWIVVFERTKIENCGGVFAFKCPKRWENLKVTVDPKSRYCDGCDKLVYYSRHIWEARDHARRGRCVALASDIPRIAGDLDVPSRLPDDAFDDERIVMGLISMDYVTPPRRSRWSRLKFW